MTNPNAAIRIAVTGEFSIFTAAAVREQLLAALDDAAAVEVDLAQVPVRHSAGVQLMLAAKREAAMREKTLRFIAHSAAVLDILELCDLSAQCGDMASAGADASGGAP